MIRPQTIGHLKGPGIDRCDRLRLLNDEAVMDDVLTSLMGEQIGEGSSRLVFEYRLDPRMVIKVQMTDSRGQFCNITEYLHWNDINAMSNYNKWLPKWYAPVRWMSTNGRLLVMDRTKPIPEHKLPKRIPHFFSDVKAENFGILRGRIVCHDYGHLKPLTEHTRKTVPANWPR